MGWDLGGTGEDQLGDWMIGGHNKERRGEDGNGSTEQECMGGGAAKQYEEEGRTEWVVQKDGTERHRWRKKIDARRVEQTNFSVVAEHLVKMY